ncbi:MAG: peptide deformylase [Oscillospiraceae bacterium]|nr:peptide deformylase [Oscillospiraceae bacterium]
MALRNIMTEGEPCFGKHCRPVTSFDERLHTLLDDMAETLRRSDGVGLAAPQVGILRRAVLVLETNVPEGEEDYIIELINPEIIERSGSQTEPEGCLSVPGVYGMVEHPDYVKVRAQNRDGETFEVEGTGLTARCFCHELDHLEGILFTEKAEHILSDEELDEYYNSKHGED